VRSVGVVVVFLLCCQSTARPVEAGACWRPPVAAPVADPFREPRCRWCPGNRGIEYATHTGDAVRAVTAGEVTFSGAVAGRTYVVIRHADGKRATYGNLSDRLHARGDVIATGAVVGHASGAFHFGVRDGERYVDPAPWIGRLAGVVRLVPADGTAAAPAGPARLVCGAVASGAVASVGNAKTTS
jgi:murein DD-endopeptidase MepM/ murein hydrolase activator NlpD